ncbi:hypothetical protein [Saccharibacillus kuerlensis]|uniref:Uncharacterized protein n=1 Tax=Saccharibacillus kuerlensis TaxID=459527 RepID=A0ABQ2L2X4_9BACL|nr:hypothetical protein [Saccharibacillus kuerlensis]GGO00743.1 hypothetical protein GCM10010969_22300 [Saccharibacillus kuerlensis]
MKMPENFRLWDYIVFFVLIAGLGILNILSPGPFLGPLLMCIISGAIGSLILGTATNLVFQRKH